MTLDPDDYDLRELRRIADERRGAHGSGGEDRSANADDAPRQRRDRRRSDRRNDRRSESVSDRDSVRRNGRRRNGRTTDRKRDDEARNRDDEARSRDGESRSRDDDRRGRNGWTTNRERGDGGGRRRNGGVDRRRRSDSSAGRDATVDEVSIRPREGVSPPRRVDSDHARGHDEVVLADRIARDLGFDGTAGNRRRDDRRGADARRRETRDSRRRRDSGVGFEAPDDVGRFQFDTEIRERPRGRVGEALRGNQLEHLLVHETAAADGGLTKPYLGSLPDAYVAERLVFDWLEFLVLKGGYKRTMDALRYYHTVEWLTEDVEAELQDYLVGFSGEVSETTEYDVDDHHLSLVYIARIASMA